MDLASVWGLIGNVYARDYAAMRHFALAFGAIGRLYAIKHALAYDLRDAKRERPNLAVPREVFRAIMRGWYLSLGMDSASI